jgi:hypothetical protein
MRRKMGPRKILLLIYQIRYYSLYTLIGQHGHNHKNSAEHSNGYIGADPARILKRQWNEILA